MAAQGEGGGKDDLKTHFVTREGGYKLLPLSDFSKPARVTFNGQANTPVKVSFVNLSRGSPARMCYNVGREIFVCVYKDVRKAMDLSKPIDKRTYKGTLPTCHDFNQHFVSNDSVLLLVGFSAGQIQLIDPIKKELSKLFNEERLIDKTKVTGIKWIPGSPNHFLVSHASGQMYTYNVELPCTQTPPHYQSFKHGDGFSVYTCKTKSTRNPLYRWVIGNGAINEFAFSPCARYLAVVSQDGFLRVFNYNTMDLVGSMKSYFGGLLCVCWSPDGQYIVTGGEDDLVTVWSFVEKKVVCRGQGHKSWVNCVAFDAYTSCCEDVSMDLSETLEEDVFHNANNSAVTENHTGVGEGDEVPHANGAQNQFPVSRASRTSSTLHNGKSVGNGMTFYRFGSVGQDTTLCLWDLTEDILKQHTGRSRTSVASQHPSSASLPRCNSLPNSQKTNSVPNDLDHNQTHHIEENSVLPNKFATLSLADRKESQEKKEHKRNFSLASRNSEKTNTMKANHVKPVDESIKLLGTPTCPRLDEVPVLEPLICKKVAHERLTSLVFREECVVTACQEGILCTWARPGKADHDG